MMLHISVIIATCKRNDLLLQRSLRSVYKQTYSENVDVVVCVDAKDSEIESEVKILTEQITKLRDLANIENFPTEVIANKRTKFHSGTGAWNTAIMSRIDFMDQEKNDHHYIAILDDDDSWDSEYLEKVVCYCSEKTGLVISGIKHIEPNGKIQRLVASKLDRKEIFVKNPGIFGSNMFVNLNAFLSAGGFDESMKSSTDRDFLMRYADFASNSDYKTVFCEFALVNHFADEHRQRVTSDKCAKKQGLDLFYYKYQDLNKVEGLKERSLERAARLFGYTEDDVTLSERKPVETIKHTFNPTIRMNLVVGLICFEIQNFKRLINSLDNLRKSPYLNMLFVYVLTNKECEFTFSSEAQSSDFQIILDCERNGVDSIAKNRTALKQGIYNRFQNEDFVTWIIDDDLAFYKKDYLEQIAYYKEKENTDLLFSLTTCEPPIPFLLTLRRNLLLYSFLKKNDGASPSLGKQEFLSEFYYDLTEDFESLETIVDCKTAEADDVLNCLKRGQSAYTIDFFENYFGAELPSDKYSIVGGNCIILNKEYLLIQNFAPDDEVYNRRSDFNWSILCQKRGARIKRIYLPLKHIRETSFDIKKEALKLERDLIGNRFYRIFYDIVINEKSFEYVAEEYANMAIDLKQRIYSNLMRIQYFMSLISDTEIRQIGEIYKKTIQRILQTDFSFSKDIYLSVKKVLL